MFGSREVWGIAFGSADLRAVRMTRSGDQASVSEMEIIPFAAGGEEADRDQQAREALQSLVAKHKIRGTVAISLPGNAVFSKFITLPPVEKKRVPEIVRYESRQQIPFPIDEVVWDYQLVKSELVPGEDIEVALFAVRREIVQGILANCLSAGLRPRVVQAAPLALCNFLEHDQPAGEPLAVLDVEREGTELLIIDGERTWPRSLGVGSQDLTKALQQKFQIPPEKAEELKQQAVKSKQADRLFGVMKPVLQNLAGQVQRTLGYYKSQHAEVRFGKVLLVGEFFEIPGIEGFFKEALRYEFARLGPPQRVQAEDLPGFAARAPALGVPLGLGLQALGLGRVGINLVPPESVQRERQAAKRPWVAAAVALTGVAAGLAGARASRDAQALSDVQVEADREINAVRQEIADLKKAKEASEEPRRKLEQMPALLRDPETMLPAEAFRDILMRAVGAVSNDIWVDILRIEPVKITSIPSRQDADRPAWLKEMKEKEAEKRSALKVTFSGRKVSKGEGRQEEQAFVQENFLSKIQAMSLQDPGTKAGTPFCERFDRDWFTSFRQETLEGEEFTTFTVEWIVNPAFYEILAASAPPPAS